MSNARSFFLLPVLLAAAIGCKRNEPAATTPTADPKPAAAAPAPAPAAAPTAAKLEPGERQHDPAVQTTWDTPEGTALATVVETGDDPRDITLKLVITMPGGARHVPVTTPADPGQPTLKHIGKDLVLRWEIHDRAVNAGNAEDWLIRWNTAKGYPTQRRHWESDYAYAPEPQWAGGPKQPKVAASEDCCCAAEIAEGNVVEMTQRKVCKGWSGTCVAESECLGDLNDPVE